MIREVKGADKEKLQRGKKLEIGLGRWSRDGTAEGNGQYNSGYTYRAHYSSLLSSSGLLLSSTCLLTKARLSVQCSGIHRWNGELLEQWSFLNVVKRSQAQMWAVPVRDVRSVKQRHCQPHGCSSSMSWLDLDQAPLAHALLLNVCLYRADEHGVERPLAKQSQFPQPLLISLVLQTLHQLRCPSLDTLQHLNVSLVVRGPKLNTGFEMNCENGVELWHFAMREKIPGLSILAERDIARRDDCVLYKQNNKLWEKEVCFSTKGKYSLLPTLGEKKHWATWTSWLPKSPPEERRRVEVLLVYVDYLKHIKEERRQGRCLAGPVTNKKELVKGAKAQSWLQQTQDCRAENLERNEQGKAGVRKAKAQLELKPDREVKVNRKGFCRYAGSKRKAEENMGPLLHGAEDTVTKDMEKAERWVDITPIFKEGKKKDPGNERPVCLALVPGKVMEQILLEAKSKYMKDKKVIANSQYEEIVDIVNILQSFDMFFYSILIVKLVKYGWISGLQGGWKVGLAIGSKNDQWYKVHLAVGYQWHLSGMDTGASTV
ncbi:hypothetical protein QYF61_015405 [Mycteria americana]|uniref:Uncharacterized protein n=1 Tax=Mycteria americana TaxID=33587 RepID=A0AAN7NSZ8_MYCAM|nr:hypothetical protein QYF61_015405 [Mycteria americana]